MTSSFRTERRGHGRSHDRYGVRGTPHSFPGAAARAQGTSGPRVSDSSVGYIDPAIPGDILRFRFDASFHDTRPTRAEFLYPKGAPLGPGLPEPEPRVDFQEISAYFEMAASERLS